MGYITTKKGIKWVRLRSRRFGLGHPEKESNGEFGDEGSAHGEPARPRRHCETSTADRGSSRQARGYVYVPATSHAEIVTRVIRRGGFGGRMMLKSETENRPAPNTTPVIVAPPPEVVELIHRARQQAEQRDVVTVTTNPVRFEEMVEKWGREKKVPDRGQRRMLSKASRFAAWLKTDREIRGVAACADDMRLVTREEYIRYKEDLLKPDSGLSPVTLDSAIILAWGRHCHDGSVLCSTIRPSNRSLSLSVTSGSEPHDRVNRLSAHTH
jgi:hypothetical protein